MDARWNYTRKLLTYILKFLQKNLHFCAHIYFQATWRFRWIYFHDVDIFNIVPDDDLGPLEVYHWSGQGSTHQSRSVRGQEFRPVQNQWKPQNLALSGLRTNRCMDPWVRSTMMLSILIHHVTSILLLFNLDGLWKEAGHSWWTIFWFLFCFLAGFGWVA